MKRKQMLWQIFNENLISVYYECLHSINWNNSEFFQAFVPHFHPTVSKQSLSELHLFIWIQ